MQGRRHLVGEITLTKKEGKSLFDIDLPSQFNSGSRIRTCDLRVMGQQYGILVNTYLYCTYGVRAFPQSCKMRQIAGNCDILASLVLSTTKKYYALEKYACNVSLYMINYFVV